ncbi:MAG: hypothetical protein ACYSSP_09700 [Planctomycetota bacterium]|jgi:hypothetical protein
MPLDGKDLFTPPEGTLGLILIPMLDLFEGLGLLIAGLGELILGMDFGAWYLCVERGEGRLGLDTMGGLRGIVLTGLLLGMLNCLLLCIFGMLGLWLRITGER